MVPEGNTCSGSLVPTKDAQDWVLKQQQQQQQEEEKEENEVCLAAMENKCLLLVKIPKTSKSIKVQSPWLPPLIFPTE